MFYFVFFIKQNKKKFFSNNFSNEIFHYFILHEMFTLSPRNLDTITIVGNRMNSVRF